MITVKINPILKPLIPDFLDNRKTDVNEIKAALTNGDYEAIRSTGHNLRGCGTGYGFVPISEHGAVIEQAAIDQDSATIANATDELSEYLNDIQPEYE